jgi:hypothetical protein
LRPKSGPYFSISSLGTAKAKLMATTCRKVASGRDSSITTVPSSGVVMPVSSLAAPEAISSKPLMAAKKPWPGLWVSGFTARSNEYLMSAEVSSRPLWNLTPLRRLKV